MDSDLTDINELGRRIKRDVKGVDWVMLLLYGVFLFQSKLFMISLDSFDTFIIPNIIYLALLCIMFVIRIKEKNKIIAVGYGLGIIVVAVILFLQYSTAASINAVQGNGSL